MSNKEKIAFGISKDGYDIKIAQLESINNIIHVVRLQDIVLSTPLFQDEKEDETIPLELETAEMDDLDDLDDLDLEELSDIDDDTFEIEEISEYDKTTNDKVTSKSGFLPGFTEFMNFLQTYPLSSGKISLNVDNDNISFFQFDQVFASKNLKKKLLQEMLSPEEIKQKNFILDFIKNPDKSGLAFVHRGKSHLLQALQDINNIVTKDKYFFSYLEPNEIALINLVNHNYDFPEEEYVLILHIGEDYKTGIVLKNKAFIKSFPIIIADTERFSILQKVYSKIILEQDISNIPITKNVLLAGDYVEDADLDILRDLTNDNDSINRLELSKIQIHEESAEKVTAVDLAKYAIPIALAWKALQPKNKDFYDCNLFSQKLIENQKYFKIAWHGFLVLAAIFYFTFSQTINNLELKREIANYSRQNYTIEKELTKNREIITKINEVKLKMEKLKQNISIVDGIIGYNNQWHYIIDKLAKSLSKNRLSWLDEIASNNEGFEIHGFTSSRRNVIQFAELFPDSKITNVSKLDVQDLKIWKYDVFYAYPNPNRVSEEARSKEKPTKIETVKRQKTNINGGVEEEFDFILAKYYAGEIDKAYNDFSNFAEKYKSHELAYDARYFQAECLFILGRHEEAKVILKDIYNIYSYKSADALLLLGSSSLILNEPNNARSYWKQLISEFPESQLAIAAKYKLNKLENSR